MSQNEALWRDTKKLIPWFVTIMVLTIITGVIGIAGNIVTFLFFRRESRYTSTTVLIAGLAIVDMVVCVLSFAMVVDITSIIMHVQLDKYICKTYFCVINWSIISSGIILWPLSIDRYIQLCQPQWKHICTVRKAYVAIGISVVVAFLVSVRKLFTFGSVAIPFTADGDIAHNVTNASYVSYVCASLDDDVASLSLGLNVIEAIGGICILLTFVFTYGNILKKLFKHDKTMVAIGIGTKAVSNVSKTEQSDVSHTESSDFLRSQDTTRDETSIVATANTKSITVQSMAEIDPESNQGSTETSISHKTAPLSRTVFKKAVVETPQISNKLNQIQQLEKNITIMMLAVTLGIFVCYMPDILIKIAIPSTVPGERKLEVPVMFATRSPFWNSVINPILYFLINPRYRQYVKDKISSVINRLHTRSI